MKTQIDPKVDYAFKHIFGREESKPVLMSLLDAVLQPAAGQHIASLDLLNPFNDKEVPDGKTSVLDIKARDESGRQFNVEMQVLAFGVFRQRALYYWSRLHEGQLREGEDYPVLRPTISVCFIERPLFSDLTDYHLIFELRERTHQTLFTDQMALHILELPKFKKSVDELATPLDRWLFFLRHGENLDPDALPELLNVPDVRWALGDLLMISQSDRERDLYESRVKMRRDMAALRSEGREEGREEGRDEGRVEVQIHRIQSLQRLLRQQVGSPQQLKALPLSELESLATHLEDQLDTKLRNGS